MYLERFPADLEVSLVFEGDLMMMVMVMVMVIVKLIMMVIIQ
jgi:hypothetical protein